MRNIQKIAQWFPRVLGVILALFVIYEMISIPLNRPGVFGTYRRFLFDASLFWVVFAISWYRQWLGALLYVGIGLYYFDRVWEHGKYWIDYLFLSGSTLILGLLFLISWCVFVIVTKIGQKKDPSSEQE